MTGRSKAVARSGSVGPLSDAFGPFNGRIWLNAAHQGPLPAAAQHAAQKALEMKVNPAQLPDGAFWEVPRSLRSALARLVDADERQIALTNSTSYGINLIAQGLDLKEGDEVLVVDGDFPATVLPWLARRGLRVRFLERSRGGVEADILEAAIGNRTRVFCTSWVFSFFGDAIDLDALGEVCRRHGVMFVVNGSQAVGARALSLKRVPMDALSSCGFKWLCGPYATGFCWLGGQLLERIRYPLPNWLHLQEAAGLNREMTYELPDEKAAIAYDVFCTANFLNYMPWAASIDHLLSFGIDSIEAHDQALVEQLVSGLPEAYQLISPRSEPERSTLVLFSHRYPTRNHEVVGQLAGAGIDVALREDKIRVAPHLYNSRADIDRALEVLGAAA